MQRKINLFAWMRCRIKKIPNANCKPAHTHDTVRGWRLSQSPARIKAPKLTPKINCVTTGKGRLGRSAALPPH
jgi:hypothetical protein